MGKDVKRLFAEFQPEHYVLELVPKREAKKFRGTVTIRGKKVSRPSQRLTLHQKGLKITGATITRHDKKGDLEIAVSRINTQDTFDEVRLHAEQMIYPGVYTVTLEFQGKITRAMNGIYPCDFEQDGHKQQLIATQFESHHAREVFPCVDEPEAKATFDLTLTTPKDEAVLSNTPISSQTTKGGDVVTAFETTPKMSTYLLAFVYGNMGFKEAKTKDGTAIRIYATPDNVPFTDFALQTAVKTLEFYNQYFDIPYPLPKCDLIALPDFASGAMENWGCITFREQCLLVDPANTSLTVKQYVAMVIAHELTHQWFGNLVTMRWWTDLWLNEGFASWMEYLAVDHLFPDWQMWTQFEVDEQQRALKLDALKHTHAVEVPVHHPDEIRTIFDTISYNKGASVIHMLHEYLTPDVFRDGLRHYLKVHAYGNTDTVDLWAALEEVSGKPVKDFMHDWTSQPGFPLLSVTVKGDSVSLAQERFYVNPEQDKKAHTTWPLALLSGSTGLPEVTGQKEATFKIGDTSSLKLNRGQSGFYRTVYDAEHLARLGELIKKSQLSPLDRLGVLSDVFEAAKASRAKTVDALKFLEYFADESDSAVWDVIAGSIVSVRSAMNDEDLRESMKPFMRRLVARQLARLGWEKQDDESHFDQLLRPTILGLAAGAEEKFVVDECLRRFRAMQKPEDLDPDLRGVIYTTAVRHGDEKTFDKLFKLHEATAQSEERTTITAALTSFEQPELIKRALKVIDTDSVRLQDIAYWVAYSFSNRHAKQATWQWMVKHWDWLAKEIGSDLSFYRFPMYAATAFSNRDFLDEYKEFFLPKLEPALERAINQGIEVITWQSAWKERDFDSVMSFFQARQ
ncbi:MAG TPA: M1 family metallopeptidase [Candidatus Limnocylindria bacterium]|nr:M1 family metallopeptidase [Candidatus Limnocylindria bacterium]